MLTALKQRRTIEEPVAIVVAHPDDETIAAGGSLHLIRHLLLVHVTDGAPRRLGDAAREGFSSPAAYALARAAELDSALALSGATPHRETLGVPDQDASDAMPEIATRLHQLFRAHRIAFVLTHAYEGGHPDHDATAFAVHRAAAGGPAVVEFAGYHAGPDGGLRTQVFLEPSPSRREFGEGAADRWKARASLLDPHPDPLPEGEGDLVVVTLPPPDAARKAAMLACFRTQAAILSHFETTVERFRAAPAYDFTAPPHPGRLNYENWGWSMTGAEWRRRAAAAGNVPCAA